MIQLNKKIVLGSGSPRRQLLLKELGLNFRTLISDTSEIPIPGMMGRKIAEYLSDEKAEALKAEQAKTTEMKVEFNTTGGDDKLFTQPVNVVPADTTKKPVITVPN